MFHQQERSLVEKLKLVNTIMFI